MKKLLSILALVACIFIPHVEVQASCQGWYEVNFAWVNIRKAPGIGSEKMGELKRGDRILSEACIKNEWLEFKIEHVGKGYIHSKYARQISEKELRSEGKNQFLTDLSNYLNNIGEKLQLAPKQKYIVDNDWVRVRSGPGREFADQGKLYRGDIVVAMSTTTNNWLEFIQDDFTSYSDASYFKPLSSAEDNTGIPIRFLHAISYFVPQNLRIKASHMQAIALEEKILLPITTYHSIGEADPTSELYEYTLSAEHFEKHLQYIKANGYTTLTFDELKEYLKDGKDVPHKSILITFDDGYRSQYNIAYPLLREYGMKATFFVITAKIDTLGFMSWDELEEMRDVGFQIASHTHSHSELSQLSEEDIHYELSNSKKLLEKKLGIKVSTFAYPEENPTSNVSITAKNLGYTFGRSSNPQRFVNTSDVFMLPGIEITKNTSITNIIL